MRADERCVSGPGRVRRFQRDGLEVGFAGRARQVVVDAEPGDPALDAAVPTRRHTLGLVEARDADEDRAPPADREGTVVKRRAAVGRIG